MNKDKINNIHCKTLGLQVVLLLPTKCSESKITQVQITNFLIQDGLELIYKLKKTMMKFNIHSINIMKSYK